MNWLANLLATLAHRLEQQVAASAVVTSNELHFDGDQYLADMRDKVFTKYYY